MDRSEASQRIRVAAAAYSPRLESSPSSQSMDTPETLETPHAVRPVFGQGFSSPFASRLTLANVFVCTVALSAPSTTFSSSRYQRRRSNCGAPPTVTPLPSPERTFSSLGIGYTTPSTSHRPFIFYLEKGTKSPAYSFTDGSRIRERENYVPYAFTFAFAFLLYYPLFVLFCFIHSRVDTFELVI